MISDWLLNVLALALLRACSPLTAHAVVRRIAALLPELPERRTPDAVLRAMSALRAPRGTCLSRSLAMAARTPGADIVIGVTRGDGGALVAHAWLEVDGAPLDPSDPVGREIARLRARVA